MKHIIIFPIKLYQWIISPLIGRNCRYNPTCSTYAIDAIKKHGVFNGVSLGIKRIGKCHPCSKHYNETKGYDPVPPKERT